MVLTVGTDCNIGKMTTQLQLLDAVRARGISDQLRRARGRRASSSMVAAIAVDAVVADFIAGAAERLVLECAADADLVLVEGQGSIIHPSYSGVTYGLLHGSLPHAQLMCAQPTRKAINGCEWVKIPPLAEFIRLSENAAAPLRPAPVIAVALNTFDLDDDAATRAIETAHARDGPADHRSGALRSRADRRRDRRIPPRPPAVARDCSAAAAVTLHSELLTPYRHTHASASRGVSGSHHDHVDAISSSPPAYSSASR